MYQNKQPSFKEGEKRRRRVTPSPFQRKRWKEEKDSSSSEEDATASTFPTGRQDQSKTKSAAAGFSSAAVACCDLLSSSSDEEKENKTNGIPMKKETRTQNRTGEWLTSLNSKRKRDGYSCLSSSEEDNDSVASTDMRHASMERRNWAKSSTARAKTDHLGKIQSSADKALQMLLWEIGFDYNILAHQFEAIRFVAGVIETFPLATNKNDNDSDSDSVDSDSNNNNDDSEINEMLTPDLAGQIKRINALQQTQYLIKTRGCLLADEMGLGKTIEALGAAALRNHLSAGAVKGRSNKPTLIVTPQDGIQQQWYDALLRGGIDPSRICVMGERKKDAKARGGRAYKQKAAYILCTRYKIQSELKHLFEQTANLKSTLNSSILFPHIPPLVIRKLRNQYLAEKGKERNKHIHCRERRQDCITRLIRDSFNDDKVSFRIAFNTVIIDECHFLKNVLAYWGIGAALLGGQSKRTVLLSGTPYNNGPSDMSALMTFIDPSNEAARLNWWENAVGKRKKKAVADAVREWRSNYMLRRQKEVVLELPARERKCINIAAFPAELFIYENYEVSFISTLNTLQEEMEEDGNPESIQRQKELCDIMMACMSCMRMALIHPIIPGGREMTIRFSPSRRHLLQRQENKDQCVLCSGRNYPTQKAEEYATKREAKKNGDEFSKSEDDYLNLLGLDERVRAEMDLDDDELDDEDVLNNQNTRDNREKGELVELDMDICQAAGSECRHFAHKKCLAAFLENDGNQCPRCHDLSSRIHIANKDGVSSITHGVYCNKIQTTATLNGFTASAKIVKAIEWFKTSVPDHEKAIILSFFKGSLDLIEGILADEHGIECARYDGDVGKEQRAQDLKRFQTSSTCRVLLASVQSGGTGLNITQANHVCFLDRWFNPQVHDQAESRCHRIGQRRNVKISYLDTALTVDCVMKIVNEYKLDNASVLLADGTSLGDVRGGVGYQDLSGVIGNSLKAIQMMRSNVIQSNEQTGNAVLPIALPFDSEELFDKVQEVINSRSQKTKKEDAKASSVSSSESEMNENKSEGNTLSNNGTYGSVKGEEATKPMKRPASQESSSSNGSILNGDIYAAVKDETKPMKYNASQEESSSSNDSILDLEIFSSKTAKSRSRQNININAADRGSSRNDSNNVIDLSFDDDDVAMQQM